MAFTIKTGTGKDYEPLQPGYYIATIFEAAEGETPFPNRDTGRKDPQLALTVGIFENNEAERKNQYTESKCWLTASEKQAWRIERLLKACGIDYETDAEFTVTAAMFPGKRVAVRTSIKETGQGGRFVQVDDIFPVSKVPHFGPLTPEEHAKFNIGTNGVRNWNNISRQSRPARDYREPAPTAPAAANTYDNLAEDDFMF